MANNVKFNKDGLDELISSLKKEYTLRIGIIGAKAQNTNHKDSNKTNAEIGTFHEFGSSNGKRPPRRSFLEDSLKFKLDFSKNQEDLKRLKKSMFNAVFIKKKPKQFLAELGSFALQSVMLAFATGGFGKWKPLASSTLDRYVSVHGKKLKIAKSYSFLARAEARLRLRENRKILVETGKLKNSIGFKIIQK